MYLMLFLGKKCVISFLSIDWQHNKKIILWWLSRFFRYSYSHLFSVFKRTYVSSFTKDIREEGTTIEN